ncbi:hypothetical protein HKD37_18G050523 [Glycine soja]
MVVERKTREKRKRKKRVEEISQDEKEKIREKERRKILKELRKEKHASYSSHNSCKSLSEELRYYYEGRHRTHLRPYSHWREKERKPQEVNINLPYFHGKDNVEANLDWEIRVEQQLKRKSTSKSYGAHSYPNKDQGQGNLGVTTSKPKDDKGKTIENMQEKTSSIKCFKCLGRGHITSQCPTNKTMIMRGQDIYSSQDEATTSPSSSESEEAKGEESSEKIYSQEEGQLLMVKEECKEVSVSSKRLAKKESHFEIKTNIKETSPLRQPSHLLLCKNTFVSTATPLGLEVIPQVKELLDEGLVRKSLNPCALLVPKIGIIRHQIPKISDMMNVLSVATLCCKISHAPKGLISDQGVPADPKRIKVIPDWPTPPTPLIELVRNHVPSWEDVHERDTLQSSTSLLLLFLQFRAPPFSLSLPPLKHPLQASYPRNILSDEAPSSTAYSLVDGVSPLLFSFSFRCISMVENHHSRTSLKLEDPASIEAPQASFHQSIPSF